MGVVKGVVSAGVMLQGCWELVVVAVWCAAV